MACLTRLVAKPLFDHRYFVVLDPAKQRLRPRDAVAFWQNVEVGDAGDGAVEELFQAFDGLWNVWSGVVGDRTEKDGADVEREAGLFRVLFAGLPGGRGVEEPVGAASHRQELSQRLAGPGGEHPFFVARLQRFEVFEDGEGVVG